MSSEFENQIPSPQVLEPELQAYLSQFLSQSRLKRLERIARGRTRHLTVVLEDLHLSHNCSACLRSCDCFGIQDVHVVEAVNPFESNADVTRGATQWLTLRRYGRMTGDSHACLEQLRAAGYRIAATVIPPRGTPLQEYDISRKTAVIFGNEHRGVSPAALDAADELLHIPMYGFTECFNISVAVALCLQQLTDRMRQSGSDYGLSEAELDALKSDWIRRLVEKKFHRDTDFWRKHLDGSRRGEENVPAAPSGGNETVNRNGH